MQLLEIDAVYRKYLIMKGAIILDDHGDEALVGLTAAESVEYLSVMDTADISKKVMEGADPERMLMLYERHTAALKHRPSVYNPGWPAG